MILLFFAFYGLAVALTWGFGYGHVRGALHLLAILAAPGFFAIIHWIAPRGRAVFALPFDDYAERRKNLRGLVSRMSKPSGVLGGATTLASFVFGGIGTWQVIAPPNSETELFGVTYRLFALSLAMGAASTVLFVPFYDALDRRLLGFSFANRALDTATVEALAAGLLLAISLGHTFIG